MSTPAPARARKGSTATDIALIAAFAALIAVLGLPSGIPVGGGAAPIVLQNLGIMLAGAVLGWRRGLLSVLLFLGLVLIGLPLLPGLPGGIAPFMTPRIGFQLSYPVVAALIGYLTQLMLPRYNAVLGFVINLLGGIVVCYAMGIAGFMLRGGLSFEKSLAIVAVFVPGDVLKAALAAALAAVVHRAMPGLTPGIGRRAREEAAVDPFAEKERVTGADTTSGRTEP